MNKNNFVNKVFITNSSKETQNLGKEFARSLLANPQGETFGKTIALYGDLGSGKTTFVQGLAKGLGIKQKIISPTFIIVRGYKLGVKSFYHIDLYRIDDKESIKGLGIEEIIDNKNNIVAIEWAEKLKGFLPKKRIDVKFSYEKESKRKITFSLTT